MPFTCQTCLKDFTSQKRLSTHSSKTVPCKAKDQVYSCLTCLKDFKTKAQLEKHKAKKNPCKPSILVQQLIEANPTVVEPTEASFRDRSLKMNKELTKDFRKQEGIFFTPKKARDLLFEKLKDYNFRATKILEPSFGTGEFLEDAGKHYPEAQLFGVEKNEKLYNSYVNPSARLTNGDFLKYENETRMDLIIGNPPYFITKDKNPKCMLGRPNIYVAFLYKCLETHLENNGYLGFILPTSLFNCSYYEPMRKYIAENCTVAFVKELDVEYYETSQDTMLIIIKKSPDPSGKYIFKRNGKHYISPYYLELQSLLVDSKTLSELGFIVKTGDVVWNQERDKLSNDGTLLIYSSNIINGELKIGNIASAEKKQYIKGFGKEPINQTAILVNRGYGNIAYKLDYICVEGKTFYAENHVNMILAKTEDAQDKFKNIVASFDDSRTKQFIQYFSGNGAISKTELEQVLPMFVPS